MPKLFRLGVARPIDARDYNRLLARTALSLTATAGQALPAGSTALTWSAISPTPSTDGWGTTGAPVIPYDGTYLVSFRGGMAAANSGQVTLNVGGFAITYQVGSGNVYGSMGSWFAAGSAISLTVANAGGATTLTAGTLSIERCGGVA
jgi:hypothetical protein